MTLQEMATPNIYLHNHPARVFAGHFLSTFCLKLQKKLRDIDMCISCAQHWLKYTKCESRKAQKPMLIT